MQNLKILNKKEIKQIYSLLENQFGYKAELDYVFLQSEKNKIYLINKKFSEIDTKKLRINSVGLSFGEVNEDGMRLSIEGSQIIGNLAVKGVLELNEEQIKEWMSGSDLMLETNCSGFVIIKYKDDFLGCGKCRGNKVYNYVSKIRRVNLAEGC